MSDDGAKARVTELEARVAELEASERELQARLEKSLSNLQKQKRVARNSISAAGNSDPASAALKATNAKLEADNEDLQTKMLAMKMDMRLLEADKDRLTKQSSEARAEGTEWHPGGASFEAAVQTRIVNTIARSATLRDASVVAVRDATFLSAADTAGGKAGCFFTIHRVGSSKPLYKSLPVPASEAMQWPGVDPTTSADACALDSFLFQLHLKSGRKEAVVFEKTIDLKTLVARSPVGGDGRVAQGANDVSFVILDHPVGPPLEAATPPGILRTRGRRGSLVVPPSSDAARATSRRASVHFS